jgi:hypothetical protein
MKAIGIIETQGFTAITAAAEGSAWSISSVKGLWIFGELSEGCDIELVLLPRR